MVIDSETPIIIYGAASTGIILKEKLQKNGYSVKAFIDKRADEIKKIDSIRVFKTEDIKYILSDNAVVILAVKNVFEHENIVTLLLNCEFKFIIYKPYSDIQGKGTEEERKLSRIWDMLIGDSSKVFFEDNIPAAYELIRNRQIDERLPITDNLEYVIYSVPVELIFTDKNEYTDNPWIDVSILEMYPHIELFRWMFGDNDSSPQAYISFCEEAAELVGVKVTNEWKKSVIKNRAMIFYEMQRNLGNNINFFLHSAPEVKWNEEGYFNLHSGKHRVCFLIAAGFMEIPVRISKADYEKWKDNYKKIESINDLNKSIRVPTPKLLNHRIKDDMRQALIHRTVMSNIKKLFAKSKIVCKYDWTDDFLMMELLYHKNNDIIIESQNEDITKIAETLGYKIRKTVDDNGSADEQNIDVYFGNKLKGNRAGCVFLIEDEDVKTNSDYVIRNILRYPVDGTIMYLNLYLRKDRIKGN